MTGFGALSELFRATGRDANNAIKQIGTTEHTDVPLPAGVLRFDGSLDLYDDVKALVEIKYNRRQGGLTIRSNGWIGHIPLNDRVTLAVRTKVPVANLERIIDKATFPPHAFKTLTTYRRRYAETNERPASLMDVLADGFIAALRAVRDQGLLKSYMEREHVGTSPSGRLDPMRSLIRTRIAGTPIAVSSRYERTFDCASNRILSLALDRLIHRYHSATGRAPSRAASLAELRAWLPRVGRPTRWEVRPEGIGRQILWLPQQHGDYAPALTLAGYLVADLGISLLGEDGMADAAVALINMDHVFEGYCRNVLRQRLGAGYRVLDGNVQGEAGAQMPLFTTSGVPSADASTAEPDIVIKRSGTARMLIDVKYRQGSAVPAREVMNQLACYAARFECNQVMALYPAIPGGRMAVVEEVGEIGPLRILRGTIDVSRPDLEAAEEEFCDAVRLQVA
ncbi:McrC family protein [Sphingomonas sp. IC4-52]|uniref:McrC family protein n=1 Tax=Sphingomonas sp. IC4-52 TaxID=2887202 RepID=UPI001D0FCD35|nr:McrC family protein [Sphingomonas sp. IC4-52]MCC2980053.1 McrC family protein [Sphingomonas sp. IC4-52]